MLPIEESFSSEPKLITTAGVGGVGLDEESVPGVERAFFEEEGPIAIDLDRHLHCQIGSHFLFFLFLTTNWGHQSALPYFCLVNGRGRKRRRRRRRRRQRRWWRRQKSSIGKRTWCRGKLKGESNKRNLAIYREQKPRQTKRHTAYERLPRLVKEHAT